jgi:hypothetical protein
MVGLEPSLVFARLPLSCKLMSNLFVFIFYCLAWIILYCHKKNYVGDFPPLQNHMICRTQFALDSSWQEVSLKRIGGRKQLVLSCAWRSQEKHRVKIVVQHVVYFLNVPSFIFCSYRVGCLLYWFLLRHHIK